MRGLSPGGGTATWCPRRGFCFLSNLRADLGHAEEATPPRGEPGLRRPPTPRATAIPSTRPPASRHLPPWARLRRSDPALALRAGGTSSRRGTQVTAGPSTASPTAATASAPRGGGKGSRRAPSAHPGACLHPPPRPCLHYLRLHVRAASPRRGSLALPAPRPQLRRCPAALPLRDGLPPQRLPFSGLQPALPRFSRPAGRRERRGGRVSPG